MTTHFSDIVGNVVLGSTALVLSSSVPAAIKEQAQILKEIYGDLVQICDGTDDDVQIQAALDALPSMGGDVRLSEGTFTVASTITPPTLVNTNGVRILGAGRMATRITKDFNGDLFDILYTDTHKSNCEIGDFLVVGSAGTETGRVIVAHASVDTDASPDTTTYVYGLYLHDIYAYNLDGDVIEVRRVGVVDLERVEVADFGGNIGIWIHGGNVENIHLYSCKADGSNIANSIGIQIGTDEAVGAIAHFSITGLEVSRCGLYGLWVANGTFGDITNIGGEDMADTAGVRITGQNINLRGGQIATPNNAIGVDINFGVQNSVQDIYMEGTGVGDTGYMIRAGATDTRIERGRIFNYATPVNDGGTGTRFKGITGYVTEGNVLSPAFAIDGVAVITVTIPHGLDITPTVQDCQLSIVEDTDVDDWAYGYAKVESVGAVNVVAKVNVTTASATGGATAKLALRVNLT